MNKDYLIYKLADKVKGSSKINSSLFSQYGVKRGLRNEDGSGVLVGLTNIGNVVGYKRQEDGTLAAVEGKLFYRGYELNDLVAPLAEEKRFGFEEVAYLLLSGDLPDREELDSFRELLNSKMPLDHRSLVHIIDLEGSNIMNILARCVLEMYTFDDNPEDLSRDNLMRQSIDLIAKIPDHHRLRLQLLPAFRAGEGPPYPASQGEPLPGRELPLHAEGRLYAPGCPDAGFAADYAGGARRR